MSDTALAVRDDTGAGALDKVTSFFGRFLGQENVEKFFPLIMITLVVGGGLLIYAIYSSEQRSVLFPNLAETDKVAVIVETLTDNKNRTASSIRTLFQKNGGSFGTQGSSSHNFKQTGVIKIEYNQISEEKILELSLNAGADDCISYAEDFHEIHCEKDEIYKVKKSLENEIVSFISTGIEWIPIVFIEISNNEKDEIINFLENLEDDDDVQNVYSNVKFKD